MKNKILAELEKRANKKVFDPKEFCFPEQASFVLEKARFKAACTSRRAGKSTAIAAEFISCCLREKNVICLYVTQTSRNARNILWPEVKRIVSDFGIPVKTDDTRMHMTFLDTKSEIRLGGAKDESQIENYRGWKLRKANIDEAQSFRPYLKYFIEDIIMPALRDLRGDLSITGTPGPIPSGVFYDYVHSDLWAKHHWTAFNNPHMGDLVATLAEERAVKGIDESDPSYIRETYGQWVFDPNALVFRFKKEKNITNVMPQEKLQYILGVDLGFVDSDAIAVVGYSYVNKKAYLVEELIKDKQDITSLVEQIKILQEKYKPVKIVMDSGGLGKKIEDEIRVRHGIPVVAAEKHRKLEFIELLNDDLRTGKLMAFPGSRFEEDCYLVQWDRSQRAMLNQRLIVSNSYHSDICDAVLYAWRECYHYLAELPEASPSRDSEAYMRALEEKEADEMERLQKRGDHELAVEDAEFIYAEDFDD